MMISVVHQKRHPEIGLNIFYPVPNQLESPKVCAPHSKDKIHNRIERNS